MKTLTVELSATDVVSLIAALRLAHEFLKARKANEPIFADDVDNATAIAMSIEMLATHIIRQRPAEMSAALSALVRAKEKDLNARDSVTAVEAAL